MVSAGNKFQAESWSVPIIILGYNNLGALLADEDLPPPDGGNPHQLPFDLFHHPPGNPGHHHVDLNWPLWDDQEQDPMAQQEG